MGSERWFPQEHQSDLLKGTGSNWKTLLWARNKTFTKLLPTELCLEFGFLCDIPDLLHQELTRLDHKQHMEVQTCCAIGVVLSR